MPRPWFGLRRVRSPLLALSLFCFLFLRVLRCFSSPGSPRTLCGAAVARGGLPHSEIRALTGICPCARLIAACHVLHRLREPRHPSCALLSFPLTSPIFYFRLCLLVKIVFVTLEFCSFEFFARCFLLPICQCAPFFVTDPRKGCDGVENNGFEPLTPCLQSRCSSQLS